MVLSDIFGGLRRSHSGGFKKGFIEAFFWRSQNTFIFAGSRRGFIEPFFGGFRRPDIEKDLWV